LLRLTALIKMATPTERARLQLRKNSTHPTSIALRKSLESA
jgi:hypothetical protein